MPGLRRSAATASIAALGALALALVTGGTANATTVTSGTVTLTIADSYLTTLANAGIFAVPTGAASVSATNDTLTAVYNATGGDANFTTLVGTVQYGGGISLYDCATGKSVRLGGLQYVLFREQFDAAPTGGSEGALVDIAAPRQKTVSGSSATMTTSNLVLDSAGAASLNGALGTTAFQAGQNIGSFATTVNF